MLIRSIWPQVEVVIAAGGRGEKGEGSNFLSPVPITQLDNQFSGCSSVAVTDIGFSDTIMTLVSVGDRAAGSSDCDCSIWSGRVTWGTIAFTDKSFVLLFPVKPCWEIVSPEEGDKVAARLVSMFDITVTCTRGSGLTTTSPFCELTWCMWTTGESGRWVPSKVCAIAAGPETKRDVRDVTDVTWD